MKMKFVAMLTAALRSTMVVASYPLHRTLFAVPTRNPYRPSRCELHTHLILVRSYQVNLMNPRRRQKARQRRKDREATYCALQLRSVRDLAQLRRVRGFGNIDTAWTIFVRSMRAWYRWDSRHTARVSDKTVYASLKAGR